jgi:CheY-like chemotaxis protein
MPDRKILNSWKEIANYLGRGVRTVQRYERELKLPVRRAAAKDRSAVLAFSDELDAWLEKASLRTRPYVRPILVVVDPPSADNISSRKLALELEKFNVLTAFTVQEALSTAERVEVNGFVLDCDMPDDSASRIVAEIQQRHPGKPIFAVIDSKSEAPKGADHIIRGRDPRSLLDRVVEVFGKPKAA